MFTNLLKAIQTALRTSLEGIRDADIFISPAPDFVFSSVRFPCVGIKDGDIQRGECIDGFLEITAEVHLCVYSEILKNEASITGDSSASKKGVLDIVEDIHAILDENRLGLDGMIHAVCLSENQSDILSGERSLLSRKIVTYQYTWEARRESR